VCRRLYGYNILQGVPDCGGRLLHVDMLTTRVALPTRIRTDGQRPFNITKREVQQQPRLLPSCTY
jgi:hypothetical protein